MTFEWNFLPFLLQIFVLKQKRQSCWKRVRHVYWTSTSLHFTHPIVYLTVRAPRMIGQPLFSILLCFRPFEGLHPTAILSTPLCCLPISFSVCLSFSLLVQCPVGSSLQVLLILFCAHTISVFVSSQWWEDLHRAQWLVWFCSPLSPNFQKSIFNSVKAVWTVQLFKQVQTTCFSICDVIKRPLWIPVCVCACHNMCRNLCLSGQRTDVLQLVGTS